MAAETLQNEMTDTARPGLDGHLFTLIFAAVVFGAIAVTSASVPYAANALGEGILGDTLKFLKHQAAYSILGFGLMILISYCSPSFLGRWSGTLFAISLGVTFITLTDLPWVHTSHGESLWLIIAGRKIQPSEFAKIAYVLYVATILARGKLTAANFRRVGLGFILSTGLLLTLLILQGDQGMALLVALIAAGLAFLGRMRTKWLIAAVGIGGTALFWIAWMLRTDRILAFWDPIGHKTHEGFQILTMKIALARGGLAGLGLGMCPEKWHYLPEPHNDAIFAVIGCELGFIGAVMLIGLLGAVVMRCIRIGYEAPTNTGYFIATGVAIMLAVQIIVHLAVATHLMPITGLTLPFISYGGSSIVSCLMAIGLVLAVRRYSLVPESER
ncbi:MAG: FtsW/RodA/SpoVE family cell cycle protein [Armatimonadota bacterium]